MRKTVLVSLMLLLAVDLFSQKQFFVTIIADSSMDAKGISINYYNGRNKIFVSDSFVRHKLIIRDNFYSPCISLHIEYRHKNMDACTDELLINEKPARITLTSAGDPCKLQYTRLSNAMPAYDTGVNQFFNKITRYRIHEAEAIADLWQQHGSGVMANDSLHRLHDLLYKRLNERTMSFFSMFPSDYLSFWYFHCQVIDPSLNFFEKDTAYLQSLLQNMYTIFPKKFTTSSEGKQLAKKINNLLHPSFTPALNQPAPNFIIKDAAGKTIKLDNYKGNYILLDFWASWCAPCMQQVPFIKTLRANFPENQLVIIGISIDRSSADFKKALQKNKFPWINALDNNNKINDLYGIISIPVTMLINKTGLIVYDSRVNNDKEELTRLLKDMR